MSDLERCHDPAYPTKQWMNEEVSRFELGSTPSLSTTSRHVGFLFKSLDEKQLYQVHLNGFLVHRLAPYEGWSAFQKEASRLWAMYRTVVRPQKVTRLAVRYINRFDIPPGAEMKEYLRTSPEISPDIHQGLSAFFMNVMIPQADIQSTVILNVAAVPPVREGVVSILLDIDLYRESAIEDDDGQLLGLLEQLRARKNQIFEACITDRMREAFR